MTKEPQIEAVSKEIEALVEKARVAREQFKLIDNQEKVNKIVSAAADAAMEAREVLAKLAVEETGFGVVADKVTKNFFATEYVENSIKELKTVGIVERDDQAGTITFAEPVGIICGVVPTTNPTSTTIFKILISLKTRNPIIFSFHPGANECSKETARILYKAAVEAGAPENCIQFIEVPSIDKTNALMHHNDVAVILATGGSAMVKAAYSCGKPALGVGPGNVPAYVHESADLNQAITDIIFSKTFDNGVICASEQAAILDEKIYDEAIKLLKAKKVYFVNEEEKQKLEEFLFGVHANSESCSGAKLNTSVVGRPAVKIAEMAGIIVPEDTVIIAAEISEVGLKEPLSREKLSPVLAVIKAHSTDEGIESARQMVELNGLGHTAAIHTNDEAVAEKFGEIVDACRLVWNTPAAFGAIGGLYNSLVPSMTLGCGSFGRNSFSKNVSAANLINFKILARRQNTSDFAKAMAHIYE